MIAARTPGLVERYFEADAERNVEEIVALFGDDATVIDEGQERPGSDRLREWQLGPASKYEYKVTINEEQALGDQRFRVKARLDGNFPGGTAELNFDFVLSGDRIGYLKIAP